MLREELESVTAELNAALEASRGEVESLRDSYEAVTTDLQESEEHVLSLQKICKNLEQELKRNQSLVAPASAPGPSSSTPGPSSHLVQGAQLHHKALPYSSLVLAVMFWSCLSKSIL